MKKRLFIFLAFMLCALCACGNGLTNKKTEENATMNITKEYLIAHSDLTDSDFEGIDFEDFVRFYELTEEDLEKYDVSALLRMYEDHLSEEPVKDYTPVFDSASGVLTDGDLDNISVIIWEYHEGTYNSCMVVDFESGSAYYGTECSLDRIGESDKTAITEDDDRAYLAEALRKSGVTEWQNEYIGTSEGTTGHFAWAIGVKLSDGRCVHYHGNGVLDSGTPETMKPLLNEIKNRFA